MSLVGYFDGLCESAYPGGPRNPGGCACGGWWIPAQPDYGIDAEIRGHRCYGSGVGFTNNIAEYRAALDCLRAIYAKGFRGSVVLRGDSKLVVEQFRGAWSCNVAHLQQERDKLIRVGRDFFHGLTLEWVPRAQNEHADRQSRLAYEAARKAA